MTDEDYRRNLEAIESWANTEASRLLYSGTGNVYNSGKAEDHYYLDVVILRNRQIFSKELSDIEETMRFLADALDAVYFEQDLPVPETELQAAQLAVFIVPLKEFAQP